MSSFEWNPQIWWYLSRASGLVATVLLVLSVLLGILLATRVLKPLDRPAWLLALHRWISALVVIGTGVHLAALVADGYVEFGWRELLIPGASEWRPFAVGVGVVAFYLLVAVQVTSLMMKRLPKRWWRAVHLTSYLMIFLAVIHAGLAGTDVTSPVYRVGALFLTIVTTSAVVIRVIIGRSAARRAAAQPAA